MDIDCGIQPALGRVVIGDLDVLVDSQGRIVSMQIRTNPATWSDQDISPPSDALPTASMRLSVALRSMKTRSHGMTFPSRFLATVPVGSFGSASATIRHRGGLDLPTTEHDDLHTKWTFRRVRQCQTVRRHLITHALNDVVSALPHGFKPTRAHPAGLCDQTGQQRIVWSFLTIGDEFRNSVTNLLSRL